MPVYTEIKKICTIGLKGTRTQGKKIEAIATVKGSETKSSVVAKDLVPGDECKIMLGELKDFSNFPISFLCVYCVLLLRQVNCSHHILFIL